MKILLLQPPIEDFYDTEIRLQPLGLAYLKAAIGKYLPNETVLIKDFHHGRGKKTIALPRPLRYLREYYLVPDRSPFSTFYHYYRFGADYTELALEVAQETPDLVGISSLFSPYYREVLASAAAIKSLIKTPIVIGGAHASAEPEMMLRHGAIDFVIRGEGERPLIRLIQALTDGSDLNSVPNLGFKSHGEIKLNPLEENFPIGEIPVPDFSDLPADNYQYADRPLGFVITSRGCPFNCSFCSVKTVFGKGIKQRPLQAILSEIDAGYRHGVRVFDFEDDNLTFDKARMASLCQALIERFPAGELQLLAMNGLAYQALDHELLALMRRAGFSHLNLSLVSSDGRAGAVLNRPHSTARFAELVADAFAQGFNLVCYQILGLPHETLSMMVNTLAYIARLPALIGASIFYNVPGSALYAAAPAGNEDEIVKARLTAMAVETKAFSRSELFTLFVTARIINFLKGLNAPETTSLSSLIFSPGDFSHRGRSIVGLELLKRLFVEQKLYVASKTGLVEQPRFSYALFKQVLDTARRIATQNGATVTIDL